MTGREATKQLSGKAQPGCERRTINGGDEVPEVPGWIPVEAYGSHVIQDGGAKYTVDVYYGPAE